MPAEAAAVAHRADPTEAQAPLLDVRDLRVTFRTPDGTVDAVNGISYQLAEGEHLGIVGESGSGKSASALAVVGLLPGTANVSGSARFDGRELLGLGERQLRDVRGRLIGMIYQDPFSFLNPVLTVGLQLIEAITAHRRMGRREARDEALRLLELVGIPDARRRIRHHPHHFSGGMRQRVGIAMALASGPRLLIADEPTTALDVTIQAQILELMVEVTEQERMALILITHDMGIVARVAHRVNVMYAGRIVESSPTGAIFREPAHPYTVGLLGSLPRVDRRQQRLPTIEGQPPDMSRRITGCPFAPRCPRRIDCCNAHDPPLMTIATAMRAVPEGLSDTEAAEQGAADVIHHGPETTHRTACWNLPPRGDGRDARR